MVRVAIVAETFLPDVNGVTNSVVRVVEHLERSGHAAMVVAPGLGADHCGATPVERVPAFELGRPRALAVGFPVKQRVGSLLRSFAPDVVHLAAPVVLGAAAAAAAAEQGLAAVAVFQTDVAGFASRYRLSPASPLIWEWLKRIHNSVTMTLAPSTVTEWQLRQQGIERVTRWARGVDSERFHPHHRRSELHRWLAPGDEVLVGYVGRLAAEKRVDLLAHVETIPGVRVVVIGDGPARPALERKLARSRFVGFRSGAELAQLVASLDVFVHTGADETFCQSVQEAMSSGVPVVAPAAGGPLDLVHHGGTGFVYPPDASGMLHEAVATLAADPALRQRLGAAARAAVCGRSWTVLGDELVDHYAAARDAAGLERVA